MQIMSYALVILSAILYRMGGKGGKWYLNTKVRDIGVPLCAISVLVLNGAAYSWYLLATFAMMFAVMTTYNKWFQKLFGYPSEDVYWPAWAMTGFLYGISLLPYAYITGLWKMFIIRTIVLTIAIPLWSGLINEVNLEEGGRGALFTGTLLI